MDIICKNCGEPIHLKGKHWHHEDDSVYCQTTTAQPLEGTV